MFNCALYQQGVEIEEKLKKILKAHKAKFHSFSKLSHLEELIQKHVLDLIIIAGKGSFRTELNLTKTIKNHPILSLAPVILYHPHPGTKTILAGLNFGADDFFYSRWDTNLFAAKLNMIVERSCRDLGVNPTTKLPGTSIIEREIVRRIKRGEKFAACYADLDDFKAYNDYYGYHYGDRLIKITSEIIRDSVYSFSQNSFVGHIGGDDFVFIIPPEKIDLVCGKIIEIFDRMITRRYKKEDLRRGYIITENRRGKKETFSIMTLSIAVLINHERMFRHLGEISHMITDLKTYTKSLPGSNYFVERRKKY
ncbi:MAG: diguanylate cyclase [candidate division Zixibacteria bacterium]|nr:diguanylate cyclase [candidate division Zixibacteria bacterium]MCK4428598.1 diguanylate cyclase [candidate division Zixibacteria bacterium]